MSAHIPPCDVETNGGECCCAAVWMDRARDAECRIQELEAMVTDHRMRLDIVHYLNEPALPVASQHTQQSGATLGATPSVDVASGPDLQRSLSDMQEAIEVCANCGEERDEPHSWRECAEHLAAQMEKRCDACGKKVPSDQYRQLDELEGRCVKCNKAGIPYGAYLRAAMNGGSNV